MRQKQIFKYLVALLIFFTLSSTQAYAEPSSWSQTSIETGKSLELIPNELLSNYQTFITREEFAEMVVRLYERLSGETVKLTIQNPFIDTTNSEILKAYQIGIISGTSATQFSPNASITREQIAVMFYKCLKIAMPSVISGPYTVNFTDSATIASYATEAVGYMNHEGILNGTGGNNVSPKGNATREQAMVLVTNTYSKFEGENTPKIELKPSEISKQVSPAVVYIETFDANGDLLGTGSGMNVEANGKIFTNFHVIEGASKITVKFVEGKSYEVVALYAYDADRDVAVLKINGTGLPTVVFGNSASLENGEEILTIGSPIGLENTISDGLISNRSRTLEGQNYLQISAPISPGSSGGALVNLYGEVVGITSAQFVSGQNLNLAIPINEVKRFQSTNLNMSLGAFSKLKIEKRIDYDNGDYYIGEVVGGVPQGKGTLYYAIGDKYVGDFYDGLKEGDGIYYWANGERYEGEFYYDYMHGDGKYYYTDGVVFKGGWYYDEVIENQMIPAPYVKAVSNSEIEIGWADNGMGWYYRVYYAFSKDGPWYYFEDSNGDVGNLIWQGQYSANLYDIDPGSTIYIVVSSYIFDIESEDSKMIQITLPK
ncbi:MAG: hypothetical protein BGO41_04145 [Clostridiales bacterium 38-18]|nr:MAG: hypothetical protein BGO41_04145 [Clostridiales bacterium 38-18]